MTVSVPKATPVFELRAMCDVPVPIGRHQGGNAMMIAITGGAFAGARLSGEVMPGGADWAIMKDSGEVVVDARYAVKTSDGVIIQVFNGASIKGDKKSEPQGGKPPMVLTSPRFIAPEGEYDWLNHGVFVGTLQPNLAEGYVEVVVYQMEL